MDACCFDMFCTYFFWELLSQLPSVKLNLISGPPCSVQSPVWTFGRQSRIGGCGMSGQVHEGGWGEGGGGVNFGTLAGNDHMRPSQLLT